VVITNTSTNSVSYAWVGDEGQTSGAASPSFTFASTGIHEIKLTAYNKDGYTTTISHTITVGSRYFNHIEVTALPFTNSAGQPWSTTGGPNLRVDLGIVGSTGDYTSSIRTNLQPADVPLSFSQVYAYVVNAVNLTDLLIARQTYRLTVNHIGANSSATAIAVLTQDMSAPSANRDKTGSGWYDLANAAGTCRLRVFYETRVR